MNNNIDQKTYREIYEGLVQLFTSIYEGSFEGLDERGEITMPCPVCKEGMAHWVRRDTPEHPIHSVTVHAKCNKCDFCMMN